MKIINMVAKIKKMSTKKLVKEVEAIHQQIDDINLVYKDLMEQEIHKRGLEIQKTTKTKKVKTK